MTDEQAMREARARQWLDSMFDGHMHEVTNVLALLDDKDAAILELQDRVNEVEEQLVGVQCDLRVAKAFRKAFKTQRDERTAERDTALSRAEQAERERDEAREQFDAHVVWASDQQAQAEAALAEERKAHQAFREEVDAKVRAWQGAGCQGPYAIDDAVDGLHSLILPAKPADKLKECLAEAYGSAPEEFVNAFRAAIERAGGTISFEGEG